MLVGFAIALLASIWMLGRTEKRDATFLNAYLVMIALYFGAYTLLDASVNEGQNKDLAVIILTFLPILLAIFLLWLSYSNLPPSVKNCLHFRTMIYRWASVDRTAGILLALTCIAFNAYLYIEYGLLTYVGQELQQLGINIPTWVGPLKSLIRGLGMTSYLFILALLLTKRVRFISLYGGLFLVLGLSYLIEGRRAMIEISVLTLFMWAGASGRRVYSARNLPYLLGGIIAFFIFSNIFQTYRTELLTISAKLDESEIASLSDAALNTEASMENYRTRRAMWTFNYMITAEQLENPGRLLYGGMLFQSFVNAIPAFLANSRTVLDSDEMTANLYGFDVIDYPTNDFASFQTDFGILMLVALPLLVCGLMLLIYKTSKLSSQAGNLFHLVASALTLQYLVRIENSYGDFFILFRDLALLGLIIILIDGAWKELRLSRRPTGYPRIK
jgi:hypothetical protein